MYDCDLRDDLAKALASGKRIAKQKVDKPRDKKPFQGEAKALGGCIRCDGKGHGDETVYELRSEAAANRS